MLACILKVCLYLKHATRLTELLRKEKEARLVRARSFVNYKLKPAFSIKHVNKKLVNENCSKILK